MKKLKIVTVVGTRPEIIRLSRVLAQLDAHCEHVLVHTGQNWDPQLSDVFFKELAIRQPDHWLEVPVTSLGAVLGGVLSRIEPVLVAERPDAVLVLGDTNSCIAAVMAKRMGIPVFHMEAGNRCFDENVPEETNRRLIDHVADFNLCYTEHARRNLLAEGLPTRRIFVTGSPMAEVIAAYDAPFPTEDLKEGARQFPVLVPAEPDDLAAPANRAAWESLATLELPFLCAFSDQDPITKGGDRPLREGIPGAQGQPHTTIVGGGHFLQEDKGPELAAVVNAFIAAT